jgi:hypothetical protein
MVRAWRPHSERRYPHPRPLLTSCDGSQGSSEGGAPRLVPPGYSILVLGEITHAGRVATGYLPPGRPEPEPRRASYSFKHPLDCCAAASDKAPGASGAERRNWKQRCMRFLVVSVLARHRRPGLTVEAWSNPCPPHHVPVSSRLAAHLDLGRPRPRRIQAGADQVPAALAGSRPGKGRHGRDRRLQVSGWTLSGWDRRHGGLPWTITP